MRATYRRGCGCPRCRLANTQYVALRRHLVRYPDPRERVDAGLARACLQTLRRQGVGYRRAAQIAGLSPDLVADIRTGRVSRIHAATQTRILAIRPSLARGQRIPGWRTWRLLDSLLGEGYPRREVARRLGLRGGRLRVQHRHVTVLTALRVQTLYARINADVPEDGRYDAEYRARSRRARVS